MAIGLRLIVGLAVVTALSSCAYSIKDIDVTKVQPECARHCTETYSSCIQGGPIIGSKMETLRACREAFAACVQTCPAK